MTTHDDYWSPEPVEHGAVAEWLARQPKRAAAPTGYAGRDVQVLHELEAIVGYFANYAFHAPPAAQVPDPDDYGSMSCEALLGWLGDLARHMQDNRLSFAEVHLQLSHEARQQLDGQAVTR